MPSIVPRITPAVLAVFVVLLPEILAADKCTPGCVNCDTSNQTSPCTLCDVDYVLTLNKTCEKCPLTKQNCAYCSGPTKCRVCNDGHILSSKKQTCVKCSAAISGCEQCDGTAEKPTCNVCLSGYAYNTDKGKCQKCPNDCKYCEPSKGSIGGQCFECNPGYATVNGSAPKVVPLIATNASPLINVKHAQLERDYFWVP